MGNPVSASAFIRLLDKRLNKVFKDKYNDLPRMIPKLYNIFKSTSAWNEFYNVGSIPDPVEFNGKLETLSIDPGFHTKIEDKPYAGKIQIERKLLDDDQYGVIVERGAGLKAASMRKQEKLGVEPFAHAFSAAFTFMTSEEGVALCSDSHTTKSTVSTSTGFDNAGAETFSKSAVATTRVGMAGFKSDIGERIDIPDDLALVLPTYLHDQGMEIVGSDKDPESANNTKNVHQGRYEVIEHPRLDDHDTNNWFMVSKSRMKNDLIWIDRMPVEINFNIDFNTFQNEVSTYFRCGYGFLDWRWIYGHQVT